MMWCFDAAAAEDTNAVHPLKSPDLLGRFQTIHDGQLDVHQHQMKTPSPPFGHRLFSIHCSLPSHFETLHERTQNSQIDYVVLHNQHIDRRNGTIQQSGRKGRSVCPLAFAGLSRPRRSDARRRRSGVLSHDDSLRSRRSGYWDVAGRRVL